MHYVDKLLIRVISPLSWCEELSHPHENRLKTFKLHEISIHEILKTPLYDATPMAFFVKFSVSD